MADHRPHLTLIAFDLQGSSPRRRRVTRELLNVGLRVQRSVFEAWLTDAQRKQLEKRLARYFDPGTDSFDVFVLRPMDAERIIILGRGSIVRLPDYAIL